MILKILFASMFILPLMTQNTQAAAAPRLEKATFAGGCFWCMEPPFVKLDGVKKVTPGYTGGEIANPVYDQVSSGRTGHLESIEIEYDPDRVSYERLLDVYWRQIDPADAKGQFVDRGSSYLSAIFYHTEEQKKLAEASKKKLEQSGRFGGMPIVTAIRPAGPFYPAEKYHQDYSKKNPVRYKLYRLNSGRDRYLEKVWGKEGPMQQRVKTDAVFVKPSKDDVKKLLSPIQFKVTQEEGTEPPFKNEYWDNQREGIYVDIVSGEPLFSSLDKYDSGTGWPSFTKPLEPGNIVEKEDRSWFTVRTEVRSRQGDSHLGHLFTDGPQPAGLRYCMNSAALRFIPREDLQKEGYGSYLRLFQKQTEKDVSLR